MPDLAVASAVDRTSLSLTDLQLNVPGVCEIVSYAPPAVSKRREWNKSPTVRGGVQISSIPDVATLTLVLRIKGATKNALDTNLRTYFAAFDQDSYTIAISLAGGSTPVVWAANDAEWTPANGDLNKFQLMATPLRQTYQFVIPVQPDPLSGVL